MVSIGGCINLYYNEMRTELKDMLEIDALIKIHKDGAPDARKILIDYISNLHDRIRQFDMVNEMVVSHITRYYK